MMQIVWHSDTSLGFCSLGGNYSSTRYIH